MDGDELVLAKKKDLGVGAASGEFEAPDGLAGAGIDADDVSAAGAGVEDALVAEVSEDGHAVGAIDGLEAG